MKHTVLVFPSNWDLVFLFCLLLSGTLVSVDLHQFASMDAVKKSWLHLGLATLYCCQKASFEFVALINAAWGTSRQRCLWCLVIKLNPYFLFQFPQLANSLTAFAILEWGQFCVVWGFHGLVGNKTCCYCGGRRFLGLRRRQDCAFASWCFLWGTCRYHAFFFRTSSDLFAVCRQGIH